MSRYIHARVYPGKDDDLIEWMGELPPGERSSAIREALRVGIGLLLPPRHESAVIADVVREAVSDALAGLQIVAARRGVTPGTNEVEETFGTQLDHLLDQFK